MRLAAKPGTPPGTPPQVAVGEVKMAEPDVAKVEAAGGKPVEQMTDEEIDAAAEKAGVTTTELTDAEVAEADKGA